MGKWEKDLTKIIDVIMTDIAYDPFSGRVAVDKDVYTKAGKIFRSLLHQQKEEILEKIKETKYRETKYGWKQRGESGTATNDSFCQGWNLGLDQIKSIIEEV